MWILLVVSGRERGRYLIWVPSFPNILCWFYFCWKISQLCCLLMDTIFHYCYVYVVHVFQYFCRVRYLHYRPVAAITTIWLEILSRVCGFTKLHNVMTEWFKYLLHFHKWFAWLIFLDWDNFNFHFYCNILSACAWVEFFMTHVTNMLSYSWNMDAVLGNVSAKVYGAETPDESHDNWTLVS